MAPSWEENLSIPTVCLARQKILSHSVDIAGIDSKSKAIFARRGNRTRLIVHQLSISGTTGTGSEK